MNSQLTEASEAQTPQEPSKPAKEKKPRTPAQQQATAKALAIMAERRKKVNEEKKEKKEKVKLAKKVVEDKIIKEDIGFVMKNDLDSRITALTSQFSKEIGELKALYGQSSSKPAKEAPAPTPKERIVERIVERAPTPSAQPSRLTGHALLDKVFGFEK